jgi:hypothetical protein
LEKTPKSSKHEALSSNPSTTTKPNKTPKPPKTQKPKKPEYGQTILEEKITANKLSGQELLPSSWHHKVNTHVTTTTWSPTLYIIHNGGSDGWPGCVAVAFS